MTPETLYSYFRSSKHATWALDPHNVKNIYSFIKENNIKNILDLGTGIGLSASVMALAFKDKNVDGHITSLEQFDKCIKIANELIPQELKKYITIHKVDAEITHFTNIPYQPFSSYKNIPKGDYDLIFVDGPGFWKENDSLIDFPNGDIIRLLVADRIKPNTFVAWDGRIAALRLLERYYGGNFYIAFIPPQGQDLHILQRKDNPVKLEDAYFDQIKPLGYFNEETKTGDQQTDILQKMRP